MKQYVSHKDVAYNLLNNLNQRQDIKDENINLIDLINKKQTFREYFQKQENIIKSYIEEQTEYSWVKLKETHPDIYIHEKAHYDTWLENGIEAKLYKYNSGKNMFFVIDVFTYNDLDEHKITHEKYLEVFRDAVYAPHKSKKEVAYNDVMDILQYEILSCNVNQLDQPNLEGVFSKYIWYRNVEN